MRTLRVYGLASEPISFISGNSNPPLVYDGPPQARSEPPAKLRQRFAFEPCVVLHPEAVGRGGGGRGGEIRAGFCARAPRFWAGFLSPRTEAGDPCAAAREQRRLRSGHGRRER